jgi:hypothetical protein
MRTLDDYIEYLVLGSIAVIVLLYSAYLLFPLFITPLFNWFLEDTSRVILILPVLFFLGIASQQVAYVLNTKFLHKPLLNKVIPGYKNIVKVANKARQIEDDDVGRVLEWGRFLMFQIGSDEMKKQNLRVFYAYRVMYGSFYLLWLLCLVE